MCSVKRQSIANISLSRNTISDRWPTQGTQGVVSFVAFSFVIDESTDITYITQLSIFIRGVNTCLAVTEEFVQLVSMTGMTKAEDTSSVH